MHTFLDNFHQGGKYSAQIASHQAELRMEEKFTHPKYLSISSLQTDYLNLDRKSGFGINSERANTVQTKCAFCEGTNQYAEKCFNRIKQEKEKSRAACHSDNRRMEWTPRIFLCGSEYHLVAKCSKPPKKKKKQQKQVCY